MRAGPLGLVCIGGTLCDNRVFVPMLSALNRPSRMWNPVAHDRIDNAAAAFLEAMRGPIVAVGFSLGGFVALEAMRLAPERVRAVILLSGNAHPDAPDNATARRRDVEEAKDVGLGAFIRARASTLVADYTQKRDEVIDVISTMAEDLGHAVHARQAEANIHRPDLRGVVCAASSPVLAIAGRQDRLCPTERYRDLGRADVVRLQMIDAGHFAPLEAPGECAALIGDFLTEITK